MKDLTISFEAISEEKAEEISTVNKKRRSWLAALFVSSVSGILVGLTGLIISGLGFFGAIEKTSVISHLGTLLIVVAFPLVMLSAHALDKIGEIDRAERQKRFSTEN